MAELSPIQPCLWFNDQAREAMELIRRPEQIQVMMQQKKIVIAELENA